MAKDISSKICNLYDKFKDEKICVMNCPYLEEVKAVSLVSPKSGKFHIGINYRDISSEREEYCILMEEQAHYDAGIVKTNVDSNSLLDRVVRDKNERRAKKLLADRTIGKDNLIRWLKENEYIDLNAIAEKFEVTPSIVKDALIVYGLYPYSA